MVVLVVAVTLGPVSAHLAGLSTCRLPRWVSVAAACPSGSAGSYEVSQITKSSCALFHHLSREPSGGGIATTFITVIIPLLLMEKLRLREMELRLGRCLAGT